MQESYKKIKIGMAEKKLLVALFYYVILTMTWTIGAALVARDYTKGTEAILKHFLCQLRGHDPVNPCSLSELNRLQINDVLYTLTHILFSLFPVVNIVEKMEIWSKKSEENLKRH